MAVVVASNHIVGGDTWVREIQDLREHEGPGWLGGRDARYAPPVGAIGEDGVGMLPVHAAIIDVNGEVTIIKMIVFNPVLPPATQQDASGAVMERVVVHLISTDLVIKIDRIYSALSAFLVIVDIADVRECIMPNNIA